MDEKGHYSSRPSASQRYRIVKSWGYWHELMDTRDSPVFSLRCDLLRLDASTLTMTQSQLPISISAAIAAVTLGITVWFLSGMITGCIDAVAFRNAVLVDARLLSIDMKMVGSGDGRREEMTVKYVYEFDGLIFENETTQLSVFDRDAHLFNPINEAYRDGRKVKCYVDPDQPSRSFFSLRFCYCSC